MGYTVLVGPPGAGKTTKAAGMAGAKTVVVEFDAIASAITGDGVERGQYTDPQRLAAAAARVGAMRSAQRSGARLIVTDTLLGRDPVGALERYRAEGARIVVVDPGEDVVRRQASQRAASEGTPDPQGAITRWYREVRPLLDTPVLGAVLPTEPGQVYDSIVSKLANVPAR